MDAEEHSSRRKQTLPDSNLDIMPNFRLIATLVDLLAEEVNCEAHTHTHTHTLLHAATAQRPLFGNGDAILCSLTVLLSLPSPGKETPLISLHLSGLAELDPSNARSALV